MFFGIELGTMGDRTIKDGGFTLKNWEFKEKNWDFLHDWNGIPWDIMGYHGISWEHLL